MAATLTQERFSGPEWIFERKFDGIRLLAFKQGDDVRLFSRNRLPQHYPAVAAAIATLPQRDLILDGEATWRGEDAAGYYVFDILWLDGRDVMSLPLEQRRALLDELPLRPPLQRVPTLDDDEAVGTRLPRRLGRRHRQAARFAIRAPPVAALGEDEMRGVAGARRRRVHGSSGRPRRPRRAPRRLLRGRRLRLRRQGRHRVRYEAPPRSSRPAGRDGDREHAVHESHGTAAPARPLGATRDRGPGRLHRVDGSRQASPLPAHRHPCRQVGARRRARDREYV